MLVISRRAGESFLIDGGIEVVVLEMTNDKVKIGINAPRDIRVIRRELRDTENLNLESVACAADVDFCELSHALSRKKENLR